jgi:hypothetical protein
VWFTLWCMNYDILEHTVYSWLSGQIKGKRWMYYSKRRRSKIWIWLGNHTDCWIEKFRNGCIACDLFSYHENCKTSRKLELNIKCVFCVSLQFYLKYFLLQYLASYTQDIRKCNVGVELVQSEWKLKWFNNFS